MSISAAPQVKQADTLIQERSTILTTLGHNSVALEELGKMLHDIENRLYRTEPTPTGQPEKESNETVESQVEAQSDLIGHHNKTALQIMNRLA